MSEDKSKTGSTSATEETQDPKTADMPQGQPSEEEMAGDKPGSQGQDADDDAADDEAVMIVEESDVIVVEGDEGEEEAEDTAD